MLTKQDAKTRTPLELTPAQLALVAGGAKKKSSGISPGSSSSSSSGSRRPVAGG